MLYARVLWSGNTPQQQQAVEAVLRSDVAAVEALLADGAFSYSAVDTEGRTCLHIAAANVDVDMLAVLVARSDMEMDVDARDSAGNTALHIAVSANCDSASHVSARVDCVRMLLQSAAQVCGEWGWVVRHRVC